jgi:hypothetical protein
LVHCNIHVIDLTKNVGLIINTIPIRYGKSQKLQLQQRCTLTL